SSSVGACPPVPPTPRSSCDRSKRPWEPSKVFKRLHQTADQCGAITALDERDKAHARVAEDGGKPVDLAGHAVLLILELAPIKLYLLSWPGFKALHRSVSRVRGTQGVDKG